MPRLLFEKTGNAVWISHLDLMRLFQRAFKRAGLSLKHTQGYNPRPSVSIALPLSVGVESHCELLDFELDGNPVPSDEIVKRLNQCLTDGIRVLSAAGAGRKIRDISLLSCTVILEYDAGVADGAAERIEKLFSEPALIVPKKTKSGIQDQNIIPMIRRLSVKDVTENTVRLSVVVCCQNPTLNPAQIVSAISMFLPDLKPDFSRCIREEIFDEKEVIFR